MITIDMIGKIRRMHRRDGKTQRQISRETGLSRNTMAKWLDESVESAGSRRGAQMGVLNIDHPDVLQFITAKREVGRWNNFNVSVGIVAGFMEAVDANGKWELVHKAEPSKKQKEAGAYQRADGLWVYEVMNYRHQSVGWRRFRGG